MEERRFRKMSSPDHNKPGGKPGQRNRKAEQRRSKKPDQPQSPMPERQQDAKKQIDTMVASTEIASVGAAPPADTSPIGLHTAEQRRSKKPDQPQSPMPERQQDAEKQIDTAVASSETASVGAAAPADTSPIGLLTIATAYSDYTRKSLEETRSFVEKLSGVRSLDKAVEVQTEFAKQAYETFVAESQKMRELYGKLARQTFKPLEGFVTKSTRTPR
jgi:hypothetical protein